jgi:HD-like signal output (HDOD) protein
MISAVRGVDVTITRDAIFEHARKLPAAAQILSGLCELLQDPNTDLDQISSAIRFEPTLAARVIRMSNSTVFGAGGRVGSVDEAVSRVGFTEVLRLVGAATVAGLVDESLGCYGITADRLRESLLCHALASEALASYTDIDPRTAYSGGLVRCIGMMVLDRAGRPRMAESDNFDPKRFDCYWQWEAERFGVVGNMVTMMILEEWLFPAGLVAALQDHLLLRDFAYENRFACILNLAGAIVAENGVALPGEAACWTVTPEKLAAIGIDENKFRSAATQATALFERQRSELY